MIILLKSILFTIMSGCLIYCATVFGQINSEVNDRPAPYLLDETFFKLPDDRPIGNHSPALRLTQMATVSGRTMPARAQPVLDQMSILFLSSTLTGFLSNPWSGTDSAATHYTHRPRG